MGFDNGEISAYCHMVQRGKPAALVSIQERYLEEAVAFIERVFGLKTHVEKLSEGWMSLWIYRYPHILEIIKVMPQEPKTVFEHWLLGKLFGYEESAILEFLESRRE